MAAGFPSQHARCRTGSSDCTEDESHSFRSPQKVSRPDSQVGLLARREVIVSAQPLHLPRLNQPSGHRNGIPSFTVAGPRRFCTGLPCYPLAGHLILVRYHTHRRDVNLAPARPITGAAALPQHPIQPSRPGCSMKTMSTRLKSIQDRKQALIDDPLLQSQCCECLR
jgi:hypothetical protein